MLTDPLIVRAPARSGVIAAPEMFSFQDRTLFPVSANMRIQSQEAAQSRRLSKHRPSLESEKSRKAKSFPGWGCSSPFASGSRAARPRPVRVFLTRRHLPRLCQLQQSVGRRDTGTIRCRHRHMASIRFRVDCCLFPASTLSSALLLRNMASQLARQGLVTLDAGRVTCIASALLLCSHLVLVEITKASCSLFPSDSTGNSTLFIASLLQVPTTPDVKLELAQYHFDNDWNRRSRRRTVRGKHASRSLAGHSIQECLVHTRRTRAACVQSLFQRSVSNHDSNHHPSATRIRTSSRHPISSSFEHAPRTAV
ncbi:hypothetical protein LXA43DRAFT_106270 [Ganoderma leucocontextum]|nr:hypothetical protein LXA43DRAFT_106270 [Ganoderma leucocontextum]